MRSCLYSGSPVTAVSDLWGNLARMLSSRETMADGLGHSAGVDLVVLASRSYLLIHVC